MNLRYIKNGGDLLVIPEDVFSLPQTLDCGQAFRWEKGEDGKWHGVVKAKPLTVCETDEGVVFENTSPEDFEKIWREYFDFDTDYSSIRNSFSDDFYLSRAMDFCGGIRLLKQEPWEALCSFIISQNNNIPRIKGIISRLCSAFGDDLGGGDFSFPPAERLAAMEPEELSPLRAGFRAKYIVWRSSIPMAFPLTHRPARASPSSICSITDGFRRILTTTAARNPRLKSVRFSFFALIRPFTAKSPIYGLTAIK